MKIVVVVVGRVRGHLAEAVTEYEKRASRYWRFEVVEVPSGTRGGDTGSEAVREAEAVRLLAAVPVTLELVALTREGRGMDSRELAGYLDGHGVRSSAGVAFVIGGAFGLGAPVLKRARKRVALSAMTLPHEMARLLLAEQLYRAGTILRGEPYHKG
jgi:23S rRNA (pseudouridine1915-N3)-methyltransferase